MGITKDFFSKPIPIPVTFHENVVGEDNTVTQSKVNLLFKLRRETGKEASLYAISSIINNGDAAELKLAQFCNLLAEPPIGLDDFPGDESIPLKERAKEYFTGEQYESLIRAIMIFYDQSTTPLEAYR